MVVVVLGEGGGGDFMGLEMVNITRFAAASVDIYVAEVIIFQSLRLLIFSFPLLVILSPSIFPAYVKEG